MAEKPPQDEVPGVVFINGVNRNASTAELSARIKSVFLKSSENLSWLSPGDTVLLKPALNSPDPYPATTHPETVHAIAELIEDRGAKAIIGDQSGVEFVLHNKGGVIKGSSSRLYEASGMARGPEQNFLGFEELGWDEGFHKYQSAKTASWPEGFYLTEWVKKADHIVNLPRLSTHAQAGVTLGFKNMVGLLRDDSRFHFHTNGPLYFFMKPIARKAKLNIRDDNLGSFFEKITEISLALQHKLRVTLFTVTKAQVTLGPNRYLVRIGGRGIGSAHEVTPDPGLIFASSDALAAEVFALAFLTVLYLQRPPQRVELLYRLLQWLNSHTRKLGEQSVWENPFIRHGLALGLGSRSVKAVFDETPISLQTQLDKLIKLKKPSPDKNR